MEPCPVVWWDQINLFGFRWCQVLCGGNQVRSTKTSMSCLQSSMCGSVMVWGCMSAAGTGELTVHWGNHECQHVLWHTEAEHDPLPSEEDWAAGQYSNMITTPNTPPRLVMDLAKHVSRPNPYWALWGILKRKVEERKISNIHQLRDVVMEKGKRTPVATVKLWAWSSPRGLRQCWKIMVATQNIDTLGPNLDIFT